MGKTNWKRVFLGGLLAGVVFIVLEFVTMAIYMRKLWASALEALGHPMQQTIGGMIFWIVCYLVFGILAVWLYSAIRPRYGAGAKTAVIAGLFFWVLGSLFPSILLGSMGLFSANLLFIDSLTTLIGSVVSTLLGAWVYKEQSQ